MTRRYDPQSIIPIPQFDAGSCSSVVSAMLQLAVKEKKLPPAVQESRDLLAKSLTGLESALGKTLTGAEPAADADPEREEATAWTAAEELLSGTMKLPASNKKAAIAARLHQLLFGDGLAFLRGAAAKRWSETTKRLTVVREQKLSHDFESVGGAEFLAAIEDKHSVVGRALGFTVAKAPPEPTQVKERFDEVKTALRFHVLQLAASIRPSDAASGPLAERLLSPLTNYAQPARSPPSKVAGKTGDPGTQTAAAGGAQSEAAPPTTPAAPTA